MRAHRSGARGGCRQVAGSGAPRSVSAPRFLTAVRTMTGAAVLAGTLAASLALSPAGARAAGELAGARVELRDGRVLQGALRQVETSLFLLQSPEALYEITGDEIRAVNGQPGVSAVPATTERLIRYERYEVVRRDGDVELWSRARVANDSKSVWTFIRWGAKESELEMTRTMESYDAYGHRLAHRIEPRKGTDLYDVFVDLAVPVAPGEEADIAHRYLLPGAVRRDGDRLTYTFPGDFPEDRLLQRKVALPEGAEVLQVEPAPAMRFENGGSTMLIWRRYYPRGERYPLTVTYRLPERAGQAPR